MTRSYRYRLNPTKAQTVVLLEWLRFTRELYNAALEERRGAWQKQIKSISRYDQQAQLLDVRKDRPEFSAVPVVILRGALSRLDKAFQAFFRRCKSGEKPGYPRFKNKSRWSSLLIDDLQKKSPIVAGGKRVKIPLLGKVKFKQHRPIEGIPKAMRLTIDFTGRWFVTLACVDVPRKILPVSNKSVGIDLGLLNFAAMSEGETFSNPKLMNNARICLERAQRLVTRRKRGSKRRKKAVKILARHHDRVTNLRREHHISVAKKLVSEYGTIFVEKLSIKNMIRSSDPGGAKRGLNRSIQDASWGNFVHWLNVKAEEAGREVIEVDPHNTSQICSGCGTKVRKDLSVRVHDCPHCGLILDRDINAARNILRLGLSLRGAASVVDERRGSVKSASGGL